ncbi:MAG TPA: Xaa-Pro dipeptidase, partial [Brevundimonas sp.]|nr:Xaa-Pro dipeptidase [Brevundimonas sp.]
MRSILMALGLLLLSAVPSLAQQGAVPTGLSPDGGTTFLQVGRLLADPGTGRILTDKTVVIADGRVVEIRDGFFVNEAEVGRIIDLRGAFVLPGLIDSHVHLTSQQSPTGRLDAVTLSTSDRAMIGVRHARLTLMAGFTTVADLGGANEAVFALRDAIRRGDVVGPRIIASGSSVSIHGGHGDANGYRDEVLHVLSSPSICSGVDDCMRAVREQVRAG